MKYRFWPNNATNIYIYVLKSKFSDIDFLNTKKAYITESYTNFLPDGF